MTEKKTKAIENNHEKAEKPERLELSFEQAVSELEEIVGKLNSSSVRLDEMIALFERGTALSEHCTALLEEYDGRVAKAMRGTDGEEA